MTTEKLILTIAESLLLCEKARKVNGDELAERGLRKTLLLWLRCRPFTLHTEN